MLLHLLFGRDLRHIKHQRQRSFFCEVSDPPAGQAFDYVAGSLCVRMVSERQFQFETLSFLVCVCLFVLGFGFFFFEPDLVVWDREVWTQK